MSVVYIIHAVASVISVLWLLGVVIAQRRKIKEFEDHRIPLARAGGVAQGREEMSQEILDKVVEKNREALRRLAAERDQLDLLLDVGAITKAQHKERRRAHEKEGEALAEGARQARRDHGRRVGFRVDYERGL